MSNLLKYVTETLCARPKKLTAKHQNTVVDDYDGKENTKCHKAKDRREYLIMRKTNYVRMYDKNVWVVSGGTASAPDHENLEGGWSLQVLYIHEMCELRTQVVLQGNWCIIKSLEKAACGEAGAVVLC